MENNRPSKLVPALIGGGVMAVLTTIPVVNCLCCGWIIFGGGVAAYLYGKEVPLNEEFTSGDGAVLGLLTGVFGALFAALFTYFLMAVAHFNPGQEFLNTLINSGDLAPELEEAFDEIDSMRDVVPFFAFIGLAFSVVVNAVFGLVGGLIGASMANKKRIQKQDIVE